jgi:hypothetical protein
MPRRRFNKAPRICAPYIGGGFMEKMATQRYNQDTDKEIIETLKRISATLDEMLELQKKPKNSVVKIFELIATAVTVLGILSAIDIILNWLGG